MMKGINSIEKEKINICDAMKIILLTAQVKVGMNLISVMLQNQKILIIINDFYQGEEGEDEYDDFDRAGY